MTIRESVVVDERQRFFSWAAIALAVLLAAGALLVVKYVIDSPYPPAGVSDGVEP